MHYSLTLKDRLIVFIGVIALKLIYLSCRKEFNFSPEASRILGERKNLIIAFWHDTQLMLPFLYQESVKRFGNSEFKMLISAHRDGRLIAQAIKHFGIGSIAGSSSRFALSASKNMVEALQAGNMVGITPDGPKGPRHEAKDGLIKMASLAQTEILPVSLSASACWTFGSWDKMFLPKPFSTLTFNIWEPISPNEENSTAALNKISALLSKHGTA